MPLKKCSSAGQSGWKYGKSGHCYIGPDAKQMAIKQAVAIGKGKMPKDIDYDEIDNTDEYLLVDEDMIYDEDDENKKVMGFIPPPYPSNMPAEAVKILTHTYASNRKKWISEHPNDPENKANKQLSAQIAWSAVEKAGWKKKSNGSFSKDNNDLNDNEVHQIYRYDVFDDLKLRLIEPFKKTDEGYLKGRAVVTNTGIFRYMTNDGEMRELRPPEEVFDINSLDSLKMIPITNGHPSEKVTKENIKKYQIGYTGEDVRYDGHAVSIPLVITHEDAINEIENDAKRALSCGYEAGLEYKSGMAFGNNKYDAIQRDIRYNHIAVVDRGRAGDLAQMNFRIDSIDDSAYRIDDTGVTSENDINEGEINMINMKKIMLDGVEYQAEADVIKVYNKLKEDNDTLSKDKVDLSEKLSKAEADRDTFKDELDATKKKLDDSTISDADVQKAVSERLAIIKVADSLEVQYKNDNTELSNIELKKAIIVKQYPNAKLDDVDDIYITARYDAVVEKLDDILQKKVNTENKKKVFADNIPNDDNGDEGTQILSKSDRYQKFCDDLESRCDKYTGAISK